MNDLGLTELYHVGIVVQDLDEAMRRYQDELGVGPWGVFGGEFQCEFRGEETTLEARAAYAKSGNGYVELVQPVKGDWTASVFLKERGEGAYHLGYWVDDLDATVERARDLGYGIDTLSSNGGFAYLDATRSAGVHIELVSARVRPMIEGLVASAGA